MQAMEISRTGLDVEWRRLEIIATNIANADIARSGTVAASPGQRVVSGPKGDFAAYLDNASNADAAGAANAVLRDLAGVAVQRIEAIASPLRMVHEPDNPNADANGFVSYPNLDYAEQMTLLIKTSRAYESNIVAMNAAREMYSKALELGRRT